ncbi:hypothetical protein V6C32_16580 [Desulforamulus ruminis]|uniref:hypothetical protein n=1 Tax=Desulforamulus ruminis TaxID=1564 RepID=UPI002FD91157
MLFKINKNQWLTLFLIALSATIFRVILQPFIPSSDSISFPPSIIVKKGLLIPSFIIFALITYTLLAAVFVRIQHGLPGTRIKKGLLFGILFCLMWVAYLFEPLPHVSNASLTERLAYPAVDGISLIFLGLLLGKFVARDSDGLGEEYRRFNPVVALVTIPGCFLVLRIFSYKAVHIDSSFTTNPFGTMIWTVVTGIWLGIMYLLLRSGIEIESSMMKALFFSMVVFGINLFFFNFFVTLVFESNITDLIIRTMVDILSVLVGVFICEKINPFVKSQPQ